MDRDLRAVLFDLDGTLIHSVDHIVKCWQHTTLTCLGREMTREEILPTLGRTLVDAFEEIAPGRSAELYATYRARQVQMHDLEVRLVPGTFETLEALKGLGFALGVVTSKRLPIAMQGLDLFDLAPFFEVIVTMEDSPRHKPAPDPLLVAAQKTKHQAGRGDLRGRCRRGHAGGIRGWHEQNMGKMGRGHSRRFAGGHA